MVRMKITDAQCLSIHSKSSQERLAGSKNVRRQTEQNAVLLQNLAEILGKPLSITGRYFASTTHDFISVVDTAEGGSFMDSLSRIPRVEYRDASISKLNEEKQPSARTF